MKLATSAGSLSRPILRVGGPGLGHDAEVWKYSTQLALYYLISLPPTFFDPVAVAALTTPSWQLSLLRGPYQRLNIPFT